MQIKNETLFKEFNKVLAKSTDNVCDSDRATFMYFFYAGVSALCELQKNDIAKTLGAGVDADFLSEVILEATQKKDFSHWIFTGKTQEPTAGIK